MYCTVQYCTVFCYNRWHACINPVLQATQNIPTPCCRLHIAFLQIFENGHYAADQVYFYESNLKKIVEFDRMRGNVFFPQKIKETLKLNFLFLKICKYLPCILQRAIAKKKIRNKKSKQILGGLQNCQVGFWPGQRKKQKHYPLKSKSLKKTSPCSGLKNVCKTIFWTVLG